MIEPCREALTAAIEASGDVVDAAPLRESLGWLDAPWRIAVVGRVAAGKTTWLNRVSGGDGATGLGGVTRMPREVVGDGWVYVDTPGIDGPDQAIVGLEPVVQAADAVVWIVDGLQPLTASEREVVAVVLGELRLAVVVTKEDLIEEGERESVLARVRDLTAELAPVGPIFVSARSLEVVVPPGPPPHLSPRRRSVLRDAIAAMRSALPEPPADRTAMESAWAEAVREQARTIEAEIERDAIRDVGGAMRALTESADSVRETLRGQQPDWLLPVLPDPDVATVGPPLSGPDAARRAVTAAAARWLAEGQLALREWWAEGPEPAMAVARHARFVEALDALEAAVSAR